MSLAGAGDYLAVSERPGIRVTREALSMLHTRYAFAAPYCAGKDVLEVACGAGQGLGYLGGRSRRVVGGDCSGGLLAEARRHYDGRVPLLRLDAHALPFRAASFDVVLLYEALYYLASPARFLGECRRILRAGGRLLLCTVNREWRDFNPSPLSTRYFSAGELRALAEAEGFEAELYGAFPCAPGSPRDALVSLARRAAVALRLIPATMKGKEWLKRVFLGPLTALPAEIGGAMVPRGEPVALAPGAAASAFKVLYLVGRPC